MFDWLFKLFKPDSTPSDYEIARYEAFNARAALRLEEIKYQEIIDGTHEMIEEMLINNVGLIFKDVEGRNIAYGQAQRRVKDDRYTVWSISIPSRVGHVSIYQLKTHDRIHVMQRRENKCIAIIKGEDLDWGRHG